MKKLFFILAVLSVLIVGCASPVDSSGVVTAYDLPSGDGKAITYTAGTIVFTQYYTPSGFPNMLKIVDGNITCYEIDDDLECFGN